MAVYTDNTTPEPEITLGRLAEVQKNNKVAMLAMVDAAMPKK